MRASRLIAIAGLAALAAASGAWAKKKDRSREGSKPMFDRMDSDRDSFLSNGEMAAGHARLVPKSR
jgi:hypothetical protein